MLWGDAWGRGSFRRRLVGAIAVTILVSGGMLIALLVSLRAQAIRAGEDLADSFAHVIAEQTTRTLQTVDQRLQLTIADIGRLGPIERLDAQAAGALLQEEITELPFVRALSIADSEGRVVATSDPGGPGRSIAERPYFRVYRDTPDTGFHIGPPVRSLVSGDWVVSATRPLRGVRNAFGGLVVAAIDVAFFDRLWRAVDLGEGGAVALFRRDGMLIMRSPFDEATIGKSFPNLPSFELLRKRPSGRFSTASFVDGQERLFAYRVLPEQPELVVVVGRTRALVLASWRQLVTFTLSIWAIASLVIITLGVFLDRAWVDRLAISAEAKETAERFALATEASSIGVWDWDLGRDRWVATPTFFAILGASHEPRAFSGEQWLDYIHPEERQIAAASVRDALAGVDVPYHYEARVLHADGSTPWVRVIGRVLARDERGQPRRILGVMIDVTTSKVAERALRDSEAFARSILDSVTAEIAVLNRDGVIIAVNEPWRRFASENAVAMGIPAARTEVGSSYLDACTDDASAGAREAREGIRSVLDGRSESFQIEYPCHSEAAERWFIMTATPLRPSGRGAVVSHVDVTERRQAEVAVHASLREKEALLKEVHHRVKNNLQIIVSLLRIEMTQAGDAAAKLVLKEMQARVHSMALVHEMLYKTGNFARIDLADYLRRLATHLLRAERVDPASVSLILDLHTVRLDLDQAIPCGLMVTEILTNSLKHGFPAGQCGEIRVLLERDPGGWVRLRVSDTGVGLPADFEERRRQSLGLQLVSDLTRQLGGELQVGPAPLAAFEVRFPSGRHDTGSILRPGAGAPEGGPVASGA